jgi:hypothetical protein
MPSRDDAVNASTGSPCCSGEFSILLARRRPGEAVDVADLGRVRDPSSQRLPPGPDDR